MVSYTKTITESRSCEYCHGEGSRVETVYHNQLKTCKCYLCNGSGQRNFTWSVDVTQEVEQMISALNAVLQKA